MPHSRVTKWRHINTFEADNLIDAAGAGDWLTAFLIHKLGRSGLKGFQAARTLDIEEAIRYGQAAAVWNCRYVGARGGMYVMTRSRFNSAVRRILKGFQPARSNYSDQQARINCDVSAICRLCTSTPNAKSALVKPSAATVANTK